jgi:hypothetical protein
MRFPLFGERRLASQGRPAVVTRGAFLGKMTSAMGMPSGFSELAVGAALLVGLAADLIVPDSGVSAALTRVLGASSIGLAIWLLARIAR